MFAVPVFPLKSAARFLCSFKFMLKILNLVLFSLLGLMPSSVNSAQKLSAELDLASKYSFSKETAFFSPEGGQAEIRALLAGAPIVADVPWITIDQTLELNSGDVDIQYSVAAHTGVDDRVGTISVGGSQFTIIQYSVESSIYTSREPTARWTVPGLLSADYELGLVVTSGDAGVQLWDDEGVLLATLTTDTGLDLVRFSDNAQRVLANDGRIWSVSTRTEIANLGNQEPFTLLGTIVGLEMFNGNTFMAVADASRTFVINVNTGDFREVLNVGTSGQQRITAIEAIVVGDYYFVHTSTQSNNPKTYFWDELPVYQQALYSHYFQWPQFRVSQLNNSIVNFSSTSESGFFALEDPLDPERYYGAGGINYRSTDFAPQSGLWIYSIFGRSGASPIELPDADVLGFDRDRTVIFFREPGVGVHQYSLPEANYEASFPDTVVEIDAFQGRLLGMDPSIDEIAIYRPANQPNFVVSPRPGRTFGKQFTVQNDGRGASSFSLEPGSVVTIEPQELETVSNYNWYNEGDIVTTSGPVRRSGQGVTINSIDRSYPYLEARAVPRRHRVEVAPNIFTEKDGVTSSTTNYNHGDVIEVRANIPLDETFVRWSGDFAGTTNPANLRILAPKSIGMETTPNTITIQRSPGSGGSVQRNPIVFSGRYNRGQTVQFTATPSTGYQFLRWEGDLAGTDPNTSMVITGPVNATAVFEPLNYNLSVAVGSGAGTVEILDANGQPIQNPVPYNSTVTFRAVPNVGFDFVQWAEDGSRNSSRNHTVRGDFSLTAQFAVSQYTLSANSAHGDIRITPEASSYAHGTQVSVRLLDFSVHGYDFIAWEVYENGSLVRTEVTNPVTLTLTANTSLVALLQQRSYSLTRIANNGSILVVPDQASYVHGTEVMITAVPDRFFEFVDWDLQSSGTSVTGAPNNPFPLVIDNAYTLTANFKSNPVGPDDLFLERDWFDVDETGLEVGRLLALDPDPSDELAYSLAAGSGDADNRFFVVSDNRLFKTSQARNSAQDRFSIRLSVSDRANNSFEKVFIIDKVDTSQGVRFNPLNTFTQPPSYVNILFQMTDPSGRGLDLPEGLFREQPDLLVLEEDGRGLSPSESFVQVAKVDEIPFSLKTVLLIDNSFSVFPDLTQIKEAAKSLIPLLIRGQEVAVYKFSETPELLQDFTDDPFLLNTAIDSIDRGSPTTNLYGSIYDLLDPAVVDWVERFDATGIESGYLIVLTDGSDQTGIRTLEEVITQRDTYGKSIFTIGLGNEIEPNVLTSIGNAGYRPVGEASGLSAAFLEIQEEIRLTANSLYWFNYASPKRGDSLRSARLSWRNNLYTGVGRFLDTTFSSAGFSSIQPGVFLNRNAFNSEGVTSLGFQPGQIRDTRAYTLLSSFPPVYDWLSADPSLFRVVPWGPGEGRALIQSLAATGSTQLLLEDTANVYTTSVELIHADPQSPVPGAVQVSGDLWESTWFGNFFFQPGNNWIYHETFGWLYVQNTGGGDVWIFDPIEGWGYTREIAFPFVFFPRLQTWVEFN
jgi:hypothetical protein